MKLSICTVLIMGLLTFSSFNINPTYKMAKLKYSGGGDWYGDRTALPNLIKFCNENLKTNFAHAWGQAPIIDHLLGRPCTKIPVYILLVHSS